MASDDEFSEEPVDARHWFLERFQRVVPGWQVVGFFAAASDATTTLVLRTATACARRRDHAGDGHVLVVTGSWVSGRGELQFVSQELAGTFDKTTHVRSSRASYLDLPVVERAKTLGPPARRLTNPERTQLSAAIKKIRETKAVGAVVLEAYMIPGGGKWVSRHAYKELRQVCQD